MTENKTSPTSEVSLFGRVFPWVKRLGLVVLVFVVLQRLDWVEIREQWRAPSLWTWCLLLVCFGSSMTLRITKWGLQARWSGFVFQWHAMARSFLSGLLVGLLTPLRMGEVARVTALELPEDSTASRGALTAAALFLEKLYELAVLAWMVAAGLWLAFGLKKAALLFALGGFGLCVLLLLPIPVPLFLMKRAPGWLLRFVIEPFLRARDSLSSLRLAQLMGLTLLSHFFNLLGGLYIFRMFGELRALEFFTRIPVLTLINNVPITVAGIGLRELGAMELFSSTSLTASGAAVAASLFFLGTNILPTLAWFPLEWWSDDNSSEKEEKKEGTESGQTTSE